MRASREEPNGKPSLGSEVLYALAHRAAALAVVLMLHGMPVCKLHMALCEATLGWEQRRDSLVVSVVLLPDKAPLARWLLASDKWVVADSADGAVRFANVKAIKTTLRE